jgi:DNA-binding transcriptional MerR regulator
MSMSVGQLATRAGVRPDTIRYYERSGVLPPPSRSDGDHRRYGPADVDRLLFIRGAQRLGLRLTEIRELLGSPPRHPGAARGVSRSRPGTGVTSRNSRHSTERRHGGFP